MTTRGADMGNESGKQINLFYYCKLTLLTMTVTRPSVSAKFGNLPTI